MTTRIIVGDCRDVLRTLPEASVQCCVTSPPYWNLRDYGVDGQIGLEDSVDEWVRQMVAVFREVRRVLREDGIAWINLGDSYAANRGSGAKGIGAKQATNVGANLGALKVPIGLKEKDLVAQPWRVALALQADGWYWRDTVVWHKANPMPESVKDRCTKAWEPVFMMSKSPRYFFDSDAIKEPASEGTHERYAQAKGQPFGMSNWNRGDGPRDAVGFSKERTVGVGHNARPRKAAPNGSGTKSNASFDAAMAVMPETRNKRSVWTIPTEAFADAHFATYPQALVEPCILASTRPGDLVLDPFGGAGTTAVVAERLGRRWAACELNPNYADMFARRVTATPPGLGL